MSSELYLFLSDQAFVKMGTGSVVKYTEITDYGMGTLNDNLLNYFHDHSILVDPLVVGQGGTIRRNRCDADEKNRQMMGDMMLHFDASKLLKEDSEDYSPELVSGFVLQDGESAQKAAEKKNRRSALFNIIDTVFNSRSSNGSLKTQAEIEAALIAANATNQTFMGYVSDSLTINVDAYTPAKCRKADGGVTDLQNYYNSCVFKYSWIDDGTPYEIVFKIWLNVADFKANYPYSTITDVLLPCSPEWLLRPDDYVNQLQAVAKSAGYKDRMIQEAVGINDHSGTLTVSSDYTGGGTNITMPFVVMYQGAIPDNRAARAAVRTYLLELTDERGNPLAEERVWRALLPDLFVDGEFFLIPMYDQLVPYPGGVKIERSIFDYDTIFSRVRAILGNSYYEDRVLMDKMELLLVPGHHLFVVAVPAPNNEVTTTLANLHKTYQAVDASGPNYGRMTAVDQYFAEKLAKGLAICMGLSSPTADYTSSVINIYPAYAFTAGDTAAGTNILFHMLVHGVNS